MAQQPAADERIRALKDDASKMMDELADLSKKLGEVGKAKAGEIGAEAVGDIKEHMEMLQKRLASLSKEGRTAIAQLDESVRANPYVYIIAALGLGWLLGKARRP